MLMWRARAYNSQFLFAGCLGLSLAAESRKNYCNPIDGFKPGPGEGHRPSGFVATEDSFAKIAQTSDFFAFLNFREVGNFAASTERPKT